MFAKRAKESKPEQPAEVGAGQTAESAKDSRDGVIKQLEQQLAEERKAAGAIREALDASTFKLEILEKSYAKQLAEARDKRAAIEIELKEKEQILAGLGGGHEHTLRELDDALSVIKVLKTERDQLRKQIAQGGFRQANDRQANNRPTRTASAASATPAAEETSDGTINSLIANAGWAERKPAAVGAGHSSAQVSAQESPHEEMIAPDLVFTEKDRDEDAA
jgi:chromosome segregation ATPase